MHIISIHRSLKTVWVYDNGRRYTCIYSERDGELYFFYKNKWHKVSDYTDANTRDSKL